MLKEEVFTLAGLTSTESKVLSSLLRLGPSTASSIAKNSGLFRRQAYDALDRLNARNLVSFVIKNKLRVYSVARPEDVVSILKKRRDEIDSAIPQITRAFTSAAKENVTILTGIPGIKLMLKTVMDTLEEDPKKNKYKVMRTDLAAIHLLGNWLRRWHKKRAALGLDGYLIFTAAAAWRGVQLSKLPHTYIRYLKSEVGSPVGLHSCGDYAWVIFWGRDNSSALSIQIKDEKIARAFDEYFQLLWDAAETTPPKENKTARPAS